MLPSDYAKQADHHAEQAEQILNSNHTDAAYLTRAQVHATLSVAYSQRLLAEIEVLKG